MVKRNEIVFEDAPIPKKKYFTIGDVSKLCGVKPHVLRFWESEFSCIQPITRQSNHRRYQENDVIMIRKIRDMLYKEGFTIAGVRRRLNVTHPQSKEKEQAEIEIVDGELTPEKLEEIKSQLKDILDEMSAVRKKS